MGMKKNNLQGTKEIKQPLSPFLSPQNQNM